MVFSIERAFFFFFEDFGRPFELGWAKWENFFFFSSPVCLLVRASRLVFVLVDFTLFFFSFVIIARVCGCLFLVSECVCHLSKLCVATARPVGGCGFGIMAYTAVIALVASVCSFSFC